MRFREAKGIAQWAFGAIAATSGGIFMIATQSGQGRIAGIGLLVAGLIYATPFALALFALFGPQRQSKQYRTVAVFFARSDQVKDVFRYQDTTEHRNVIEYLQYDEHIDKLKIVSVCNDHHAADPQFTEDLKVLGQAYPQLEVEHVEQTGDFTTEFATNLLKKWNIPANQAFAGSPGTGMPECLGPVVAENQSITTGWSALIGLALAAIPALLYLYLKYAMIETGRGPSAGPLVLVLGIPMWLISIIFLVNAFSTYFGDDE